MRKIEFKGQRVDNGKWVFGAPFFIKEENFASIITNCQTLNFKDATYTGYEVKPESISQYIGHKDKNNDKIYENDRVLYDGVLGSVFYSEDLAMFMVRFDYTNSIYSFDSLDRDVEVV